MFSLSTITASSDSTSTVSCCMRRITAVSRVTVLVLALFLVTMPTLAVAKEGGLRDVVETVEAVPVHEEDNAMSDPTDLSAFEPVDLTDFLSPEQQEEAQSHRELGTFCNVCIDSPNGFRGLTNHGKTFWNNGKKWTCGEVAASMRDVRVDSSAAPGERQWCATVQQIVVANCDCYGAELVDQVKDPNPGCKLCLNGNVPAKNYDKLVKTGVVGSMNCQGLEYAMKQGVLTANTCSRVAQNSRATCCK